MRNLQNHERRCDGTVKCKYPGGVYMNTPSIFEELESNGIIIADELKFRKYFPFFDFEAYQRDFNRVQDREQEELGEHTTWNKVHVPISYSVSSNVPGAMDVCHFASADPKELINHFVGTLLAIARQKEQSTHERFEDVYAAIDLAYEFSAQQQQNNDDNDDDDMDLMLDDDTEEVETDRMKKLSELKQKLEDYCKELAVLGFNSSSYDINLLYRYLFQALIEHQEQPKFTVKKSSRYPCIKSEHLKFMDVLQFMAPGYNLKAFFKAFDTTEQKAWFPYEYPRDPQQLEEKQLPPYESFYSTVKGCNVLDEEFQTHQKLLYEEKTSGQALKVLALEDVPKPGPENYQWLQQVWQEEHWSTLTDYLQWYNCLDVTPMIEAIEKMNTFYQQKGIDLLHQAISLPGVAIRYCFNSIPDPSIEFHHFNHQNKEIYKMIKDSIVGGPSIIFNRYHEVNVTNIHNDLSKPCKSIVGYDASALYLYSIGQPMPTGYPIIRRAEKQFKAEKPYFAGECADWPNWLSHSQGTKIQHGLTTGERRIGKYKVDRYCEATKTIYEFRGCWWHMHGCIDRNKYDDRKHAQ